MDSNKPIFLRKNIDCNIAHAVYFIDHIASKLSYKWSYLGIIMAEKALYRL